MSGLPFFPDAAFAWIFCLTLIGLTAIAAVIDAKTLTIPKPLVAVVLALGLIFNLIRTAWLGAQGQPGPFFGLTGVGGGVVEGLTFSLAGFALGFGLFFFLWALGTCGGGDVKLFAALGAWLGPLWTLYLLVATYLVVLIGFVGLGWLLHVLRSGQQPRRNQIAYSFPVALGTVLLLLWVCRDELGLVRLVPESGSPPTVQIAGPSP